MIGAALLDSVAAGALAAIVATIVTRLCGSAATRHAVWVAALASVPMLSIGVAMMPVRRVATATAAGGRDAASLLLTIWGVIASLLLIRIAIAYVRLRLLERAATPAVVRGVAVRVSDRIRAPLFSGSVLVPKDFALADDDVDRLLRHELAHERRRDDLTRLLQQAVKALLFFNPFVHAMARAAEFECELACDVEAARASGGEAAYAEALARLVTLGGNASSLAPAAMSRRVRLAARVDALLTREDDATLRPVRVVIAIGMLAALIALVSPVLVHRVITLRPVVRNIGAALDPAEEEAAHYGRALGLYWGGHPAEAAEEFRIAEKWRLLQK